MQDIFITKIKINEVRNIKDFEINLSETERKHLIITGKNGSGKTSLLEELKTRLNSAINYTDASKIFFNLPEISNKNYPNQPFANDFFDGKFIIKYFQAKRGSNFIQTNGIRKIEFKRQYGIDETIGNEFTQHIVNLQFDKLYAKDKHDFETSDRIDNWISSLEKNLAELFDKPNFKLAFDIKNYSYQIVENGNQPYNFNQLPDGYSAILDIVTELIMRMEEHKNKSYDVQGIVLIDEIETHLHVDLQKKILPFLTSFFPKIQFIVTTHSPFVINSISNSVVCDLEKKIVVDDDLTKYSWEAIIESYIDSDKYSNELKEKVNKYEELLNKDSLSESEKDELLELKIYFSKIPTIFADELAIKLNQLNSKAIAKNKR
jgi:predicted ATP-binding protein involved in virulence